MTKVNNSINSVKQKVIQSTMTTKKHCYHLTTRSPQFPWSGNGGRGCERWKPLGNTSRITEENKQKPKFDNLSLFRIVSFKRK